MWSPSTAAAWRCAVLGCVGTEHVGRGWCRKHYQRWYRTGSPHGKRRPGPRPWTATERATILTMIHTTTLAEVDDQVPGRPGPSRFAGKAA